MCCLHDFFFLMRVLLRRLSTSPSPPSFLLPLLSFHFPSTPNPPPYPPLLPLPHLILFLLLAPHPLLLPFNGSSRPPLPTAAASVSDGCKKGKCVITKVGG